MKHAGLILFSFLALMGCASLKGDASDGFRLIDLTGDFDKFQASSTTMDAATRVTAFRKQFSEKLPDFYKSPDVVDEKYDQRITKALNTYPKDKAGIDDVRRRFVTDFAPARRSFEAEFGPITDLPPVYLLHSLGQMDGGVREINGRETLIFGADMIAAIHTGEDIVPLLHHELFHLYHGRKGGDCGETVWCGLWKEGLAVYVSAKLNPKATDSELLLFNPAFFPGGRVSLREAVEPNKAEAVCAALKRFNSSENDDLRVLFQSGRISDRLPPRAGYYIGYLIAQDAGKTRTLLQLANLNPADTKALVETALGKMADCR